jgi:hypothetical protein
MTIMSIEMLTKQAKWFRWLGVKRSGGKIGR